MNPFHFPTGPLTIARAHGAFDTRPRLQMNLERSREIETARLPQPCRTDRHDCMGTRPRLEKESTLFVRRPAVVSLLGLTDISESGWFEGRAVEHHASVGRAERHFDTDGCPTI